MNKPLPREDSEPWYRQFWPWFIFSLPAAVVVAGITTVVIANRGADDLALRDSHSGAGGWLRSLHRKADDSHA